MTIPAIAPPLRDLEGGSGGGRVVGVAPAVVLEELVDRLLVVVDELTVTEVSEVWLDELESELVVELLLVLELELDDDDDSDVSVSEDRDAVPAT